MMKSKRVFMGVQIVISILMTGYLAMSGIPLHNILLTMALMTLSNLVMLMYVSDGYIGIFCFLNTMGAILQISLGNHSVKQGILSYCLGSLVGLLVYYGAMQFNRKIHFEKEKLRIIYIVFILCIFVAAFINGPVKNESGTEAVYGYVKGIAVYQFIILLHMAFISSYTEEDDEDGLKAFLFLHIIEFGGFVFSKEFGTLLVLYAFTFVVLLLIKRKLFISMIQYVFTNKMTYFVVAIFIMALVLNHFVTLPLIGGRMNDVIAAGQSRIFHPETSQLSSAKQALSITRFANPHTGFIYIYAAGSDMAFISINMRFGFVFGMLTLLSYVVLLSGATIHLMNHDTEEAQGIFMACFILSISSLIPIAGALQVIPFTGIPLYFISEGTTVKIVSYSLAYYVIYLRRKEREDYV